MSLSKSFPPLKAGTAETSGEEAVFLFAARNGHRALCAVIDQRKAAVLWSASRQMDSFVALRAPRNGRRFNEGRRAARARWSAARLTCETRLPAHRPPSDPALSIAH